MRVLRSMATAMATPLNANTDQAREEQQNARLISELGIPAPRGGMEPAR
jgi:hypothetical protein